MAVPSLVPWFVQTARRYREQVAALPDDVRACVEEHERLDPPIQVIDYWLTEPEFHVVFLLRSSEAPDLYTAEMPTPIYEAIENFEKSRSWPIWQGVAEPRRFGVLDPHAKTLGDIADGQLVNAYQRFVSARCQPPMRPGMESTTYPTRNMRVWYIRGQLTKTPQEHVEAIVREAHEQYQAKLSAASSPHAANPAPTARPYREPDYRFHGKFLRPRLTIGTPHRETIPERVYQLLGIGYISVRTALLGKSLHATYRGYVAIESDKQTAVRGLNLLNFALHMHGCPASIVREDYLDHFSDIGPRRIDLGGGVFPSFSGSDAYEAPWAFVKHVTEAQFLEILNYAERLAGLEVEEDLHFYLEALSHLAEAEYPQALFFSWLVCEREVYRRWREFLRNIAVPGRTSGARQEDVRAVEIPLAILFATGRLSEDEHQRLRETKTARNKVLHEGRSVSFEEAQKVHRLALDMIRGRVPAPGFQVEDPALEYL